MRTSPTLFIVILTIGLLSVQLSGLHMHVNPDGAGGLHGTHVHEIDADGHGHAHEDETDVSLFEFSTSWGKLLVGVYQGFPLVEEELAPHVDNATAGVRFSLTKALEYENI